MTVENQHQPGIFTEYGKDWEQGAECCSAGLQQNQATDSSGSVISKAAESVKDAASYVGEKAEQATHAVGAGMESLGNAMHSEKPDQGMFCTAKEAVAEKLEGAGQYLGEQGLKGMAEDVTNLIRKNPVPALLIGVGVGFLLARMARR